MAAAVLGCSSPQSFVILLLQSATGAPITGVEQVQVVVSKTSGPTRTLTYPAPALIIPADASVTGLGTLSVSFSGDETGDVKFQVNALGPSICVRATGTAIVTLKKGATVEWIVPLVPGPPCYAGVDGGGNLFPGCDPVRPVCTAGQTCQVNCATMVNACTAGGTGGPWSACQGNADCAPGSQCFDYGSLGCNTKVCLRFCDSDTDCGGTTDAGVGPGSFCRDPVSCGSSATPYRTCSASCDPTAAAASAGGSGCPAGLVCVLPAGMDQVACACEPSRTKAEGVACASTRECAPGLICEQTCRAVCRCDAANGACTAASGCPTAGTACTPLTGEVRWGVCL
jgi:hypothetical protein